MNNREDVEIELNLLLLQKKIEHLKQYLVLEGDSIIEAFNVVHPLAGNACKDYVNSAWKFVYALEAETQDMLATVTSKP